MQAAIWHGYNVLQATPVPFLRRNTWGMGIAAATIGVSLAVHGTSCQWHATLMTLSFVLFHSQGLLSGILLPTSHQRCSTRLFCQLVHGILLVAALVLSLVSFLGPSVVPDTPPLRGNRYFWHSFLGIATLVMATVEICADWRNRNSRTVVFPNPGLSFGTHLFALMCSTLGLCMCVRSSFETSAVILLLVVTMGRVCFF
eukprot:TRINITY_DN2170_c0_g1_i5.p1 TRINITY_DN2170_c0_g1~~TRINITY_DN2170_c0_g1_i5.p1  ORF type:complete len:200 (+),score=4.73 TRINITY_DN2170_c0_g1_i5:77-676(+)